MNSSVVAAEIQMEIRSLKEDLSVLSLSELGKEVNRLKHLRAEARRLNEAAFRDALDAAEAKAPALVPVNAMMSREEIEQERADIAEESRVIGPEVFTLIADRILLLHGEIGRRRLVAARAA